MAGFLARGSMHPAAFPDYSSGVVAGCSPHTVAGAASELHPYLGQAYRIPIFPHMCFARRGEPCCGTMRFEGMWVKADSDTPDVFRGAVISAKIRNILGITLPNWPYPVVLR
jgi:hypothetical protein